MTNLVENIRSRIPVWERSHLRQVTVSHLMSVRKQAGFMGYEAITEEYEMTNLSKGLEVAVANLTGNGMQGEYVVLNNTKPLKDQPSFIIPQGIDGHFIRYQEVKSAPNLRIISIEKYKMETIGKRADDSGHSWYIYLFGPVNAPVWMNVLQHNHFSLSIAQPPFKIDSASGSCVKNYYEDLWADIAVINTALTDFNANLQKK